jgi:hypothetical protein
MATKTEPIRPPPGLGIFGVPGRGPGIARRPVPHKTRQKSERHESSSEWIVKNIRRATRERHSAEEKIRIEPLRRSCSLVSLSHPAIAGCTRPQKLFKITPDSPLVDELLELIIPTSERRPTTGIGSSLTCDRILRKLGASRPLRVGSELQ